MTLNALLERSVSRWGSRPFLLDDAGDITYQEFFDRVQGLAGALAEAGIGEGDGVVVVLPNGPEILIAWFALARLRAVMMPVNPALPPADSTALARAFAPRAIIAGAEDLERRADLAVPLRIVVGEGGPADAPRFEDLARPSSVVVSDRAKAWDHCIVLQTSGTTGGGKGAVLSHLSFVWPAREFCRWMEASEEDRFLGCLPLFHLAGQAFAVSAVACGGSLALVDRFSASRFWDDVRRTGATLVRHLGEMLAVLCSRPEMPDEHRNSLRAVYGGGARREIAEEFERRFGAPVVEGYGLTETNTVLRNELRNRRLGTIGRPLPWARVRIADENGLPVPHGAVGEIQIERNPVMMVGYLVPDGEQPSIFDRRWFRTGDLGYRDEEGYFHFVGRSKNIIRRRGENIFPGQIEKVLYEHPAVAEAAVIGVPDRFGGEEIKVFVVPADGYTLSPGSLAEWCKDRLAEFQIPRYWSVCPDLPRTATHKIHGFRLRELHDAASSFDRQAADPLAAPTTVAVGAKSV